MIKIETQEFLLFFFSIDTQAVHDRWCRASTPTSLPTSPGSIGNKKVHGWHSRNAFTFLFYSICFVILFSLERCSSSIDTKRRLKIQLNWPGPGPGPDHHQQCTTTGQECCCCTTPNNNNTLWKFLANLANKHTQQTPRVVVVVVLYWKVGNPSFSPFLFSREKGALEIGEFTHRIDHTHTHILVTQLSNHSESHRKAQQAVTTTTTPRENLMRENRSQKQCTGPRTNCTQRQLLQTCFHTNTDNDQGRQATTAAAAAAVNVTNVFCLSAFANQPTNQAECVRANNNNNISTQTQTQPANQLAT